MMGPYYEHNFKTQVEQCDPPTPAIKKAMDALINSGCQVSQLLCLYYCHQLGHQLYFVSFLICIEVIILGSLFYGIYIYENNAVHCCHGIP